MTGRPGAAQLTMSTMFRTYHAQILAGLPAPQHQRLTELLTLVDITPAAHWFYQESPQELWDENRDFPTLALPWPFTWLEFRQPAYSNREGELVPFAANGVRALGCRALSLELRPSERREALASDLLLRLLASLRGPGAGDLLDGQARQQQIAAHLAAGQAPRWLAFYFVYADAPRGLTPLCGSALYLDESGKPLVDTSLTINTNPVLGRLMQRDPAAGMEELHRLGSTLLPFYFAVSLLHCKNVVLVDEHTPPKVAQARRRRGVPAVHFKTLTVEPLRAQLRRGPAAAGASTARQALALHFVRGHFKDYRAGPGLFGKHPGLYWWEMFARGDAAAGQIRKAYQVH